MTSCIFCIEGGMKFGAGRRCSFKNLEGTKNCFNGLPLSAAMCAEVNGTYCTYTAKWEGGVVQCT